MGITDYGYRYQPKEVHLYLFETKIKMIMLVELYFYWCMSCSLYQKSWLLTLLELIELQRSLTIFFVPGRSHCPSELVNWEQEKEPAGMRRRQWRGFVLTADTTISISIKQWWRRHNSHHIIDIYRPLECSIFNVAPLQLASRKKIVLSAQFKLWTMHFQWSLTSAVIALRTLSSVPSPEGTYIAHRSCNFYFHF